MRLERRQSERFETIGQVEAIRIASPDEAGLFEPKVDLRLIDESVTGAGFIATKPLTPGTALDVRIGPGRMQDIELLAQGGALAAGLTARDVAGGLQGVRSAGWLEAGETTELLDVHRLLLSIRSATRVLSAEAPGDEIPGAGAADFVCRVAGAADTDDLCRQLMQAYDGCVAKIVAALRETRKDD